MIIKYSKDDLPALNFRYVVQMDNHQHEENIFESKNPDFWIEKRLYLVSVNQDGCSISGFYYGQKTLSEEELVERLNDNDERYFRTLNKAELASFNKWLEDEHS